MAQDRLKTISVAGLLGLLGIFFYFSMKNDELAAKRDAAEQAAATQDSLAGSYLAARHASTVSDDDKASFFLSKALNYNPKNPELIDQAMGSHLLSGQMDQAVQIARNQDKTLTPSALTSLILFIDDVRKDQWTSAEKNLDQLNNYGLSAVTLPFLKSWTHLALTKEVVPPHDTLKLAHGFYQSFLNYQNALVYDQAGDADQAAVYYDLALGNLQVVSQRIVMVAMQFYLRQDNPERARAIYHDYQMANADNLSVQIQPVESVMKELDAYKKQSMIPTPKEGIAEVLYTMATLLHGESVDREALEYVRLAMVLGGEFPAGTLLLANILEDTDKDDLALDAYSKIPETSSLHRRAAIRRALLLDKMGKTDQAAALLKENAVKEPRPADLYMTLGDLERDHKKFGEAVDSYTKAVAVLGEPKAYHWPIFYTRGISYERAGQWDKAEADLQQALKLKPDQPDVVNYLAYSWLIQGKKVDQATAMLEQVVADRPDDGHIIDSLAWAYFLTKKYDLALEYIEQAVELMPNDPTVNDHYGDILWQVGRRNEARYQWKRAIYYKPEAEDLQKIQLKLKDGPPTLPPAASNSQHSALDEALALPR